MYKKKILLLTRYGEFGPSSRLRFLQYLPFIENQNIHIDVSPLFSNEYLTALYSGQSRWCFVISGFWTRIKTLLKVRSYDLIIIEKEIFPYLPAFAERFLRFLGISYIVDYDDAIFHSYDKNINWLIRFLLGKKIDTVMRLSNLVIVGNEYLSSRARSSGAGQVEIIPTVVDLNKYKAVKSTNNKPLVVGWIGSPATSKYLLLIVSVYKLLKSEFDVRFVAVGCNKEILKDLPIEVLPWSEETEVQLIQSFDIGIMPLSNSPWEMGKCGYKLIQYMACGLPVVASPVGVNKKIVENGINGFLAQETHEWEQALRKLLNDKNLRVQMGEKGRDLVKENYSLQQQSIKFREIIRRELN